MEEKEIERIINAAFRVSDPECADLAAATESAAEIAKLVDKKLTAISRCLEVEVDRADKYMAQLAEMRKWLKPIHELCQHYKDKPGLEKEAYAQIYRLAGYALAAAPEARDDERPKS